MTEVNLSGADLELADLRFADFRSPPFGRPTKGLTADRLKKAKNCDKAYYDANLLKQLGLPLDHNEKAR